MDAVRINTDSFLVHCRGLKRDTMDLAHLQELLDQKDFAEVVSGIQNLLDSLGTPESILSLLQSNAFENVLDRLFHESWDHLKYLAPKLSQFFSVTLDKNYLILEKEIEESGVGNLCSFTRTITRDVSKLNYEEGLAVVQAWPYDDSNDVFMNYRELAELHPERAKECFSQALQFIKDKGIPEHRADDDELLDFYLEQVELDPENGDEWFRLAEERLVNDIKHYYTYHCSALRIVAYYQARSDEANVERIIGLIYKNIAGVEEEGKRLNLLKLLSRFHPE